MDRPGVTWTDERLDDLARRVDKGSAGMLATLITVLAALVSTQS
jgi:hypothetical protein